MSAEWVIFAALLAASLAVCAGNLRRLRPSALWMGAGLTAASAAAAIFWAGHRETQASLRQKNAEAVPSEGRPGGYVSSDKCQACHPSQYQSWRRTYHRTMTQYATPESVLGDFSNVDLRLEGANYHLTRRGEDFFVQATNQLGEVARKRIGLLTGSHHMQVPWMPSPNGNMQAVFPFAWLKEDQRWVPFHATFLRDPKIPPTQHVWNLNCIECHSTGGQPNVDPATRLINTRAGEMGISCEACHGPGEAHIQANQNPLRRYRQHGSQGDPTIVNPSRLSSKKASQVCGQCHGIKWIPASENYRQNGFSYRPGNDLDASTPIVLPAKLKDRPWLADALKRNPSFLTDHYWSDGMVRVSGRDFNGMAESPCYERGELSCLSCHSLHQSEPNHQLARGMESNEACFQCHQGFRQKLAEHTHHLANSSGSLCYNCHMPHTTYGLLKAIRSHQITSPSAKSTLDTGRPNACNSCHLDRTLAWTADRLSEWFRQPAPELDEERRTVAETVLQAVKGDAGQRALAAWSMGWEPALAASGKDWVAPFLGQLLEDPYSAVRYIAGRSLKRLPAFATMKYDFMAPTEQLTRDHQQALANWAKSPPAAGSIPRATNLLMTPSGVLQEERLKKLLSERDDHSMDLQE